MDGFKLYVTNTTTIPPDGHLCYEDPDPGLPNITQNIPCNQLGKYVIYYDNKGSTESDNSTNGPIVELCYVAINGCQKNHWGSQCEKLCPDKCFDRHCYPGNGSCVWGCNPENCFHDICNKDTAVCTKGCKKNRTGRYCNEYNVVSDAFVSQNPGGDRPASLSIDGDRTTCSKTSGLNVSFHVDLKKKKHRCPPTHYGPLCNTSCPNNCYGPCDLENGHCVFGCLNGWIGVECEQACESGYYGKDCHWNCSANCLIQPCNHETGGCNGGCTDGWQGFNCSEKCPKSQFGRNCSQFCHGCFLGKCDPVNGLCDDTSICSPGYIYGAYCNRTCDDGYFGNNCTRVCNCATGNCSALTGYCPEGCAKGWHGEACDEVKSALQPEESSQAGAIGGGFAAVIIVLIVVVAFILHKRRILLTKDTKKETNTRNNYANVNAAVVFDAQEVNVSLTDKRQNGLQIEEYEDGNVYNNVPSEHNVFKYKILIEDLKEAISGKQKDEGFKKEYEVLPKGLVCAHVAGSKAENKVKNRFLTTWPCPKQVTMRDFWHMIWQENVGKIVMVTQLEENKKNEKEREIHHFHFTEWPDHGVPDSIKVVHFYRNVRSKTCNELGPIIVHCSAGIGRTGTFIAIDALYENGKKVGYINVMEYIQMMRKDRMNMVQTYEQYEAIFEALLELFTVPETSIPKKEFCQYISDQEQKKLPQNQKLHKLEFQRLETLRPVYPPSAFSAATSKENISKNSIKKIFPHNRYRPYTMSYSRTRNDYINAVIIPGYTHDSKILVTQCPLEETVVDFWTMVYDHNSPIVVLLDQLNRNAPLWLGRHEVLEFKDFTIVQENSPSPEELKLTLNHNEKNPTTITVFTTSKVNNDAMLPSNILLDLLKKVIECWNLQKGPITVVCSDGCTKSGVFVALKLILEKMEIDDEIDVFQVVRTMQVRRPEFFTEFVSSVWIDNQLMQVLCK
ncbi:unnamed protein product [Mytilus edulis]|uniref:Uncharacterized protein n=1 Tax=Mytilus edulis TaxID=6550 RepID=A0A8S3VJ67_MYTED|nr:unnamed protein product [Mytilus edulis]